MGDWVSDAIAAIESGVRGEPARVLELVLAGAAPPDERSALLRRLRRRGFATAQITFEPDPGPLRIASVTLRPRDEGLILSNGPLEPAE